MSFRLGCLPHDPAKLAALPPARFGMVPPAYQVPCPDWQPEMWGNDTLPDCTVVALGNSGRAWSHKFGGTDLSIPQPAINTLYARSIGMPGATDAQLAATDGADPMLVVETAQATGWNVGGEVPLVPDFRAGGLAVQEVARAIDRAGCAMLALTLYEGDMEAFDAGQEWLRAPSGPVVGGHMVGVCGYDGMGPAWPAFIATWAKWQPASWQWISARVRLSLVAGWRQLCAPGADYPAEWGAAEG